MSDDAPRRRRRRSAAASRRAGAGAPAEIAVLARRLRALCPASRAAMLLLNEIAILGAVRALARSHPRLCRHRLARPRRLLRPGRLCRRAARQARHRPIRSLGLGVGRRAAAAARLRHELPGAARHRPDAADGDARRRARSSTSSPTRRPGSPAAPTACRASRWGRSSACSSSTSSAAPPISTASPCCSCCSCRAAHRRTRPSACRCAPIHDNPLRAARRRHPGERGASSRSTRSPPPMPASPARCSRRRRSSSRSTCSTSTARPTCCWCW